MRVSRSLSLCVRAIALVCLIGLIVAPVLAQQASQQPLPEGPKPQTSAQASMQTAHLRSGSTDYSKGANALTFIGPYKAKIVPPPVLKNTPRIDQLMQGGKLMLSLNDAIALALENNLDLAIARYNNDIADTDLLRVKSGAGARGVNTGLVANTPGGTGATSVGGGAGGTSAGAGGAGTGAGGIVSSTAGAGPAIDSFDPVVTANVQFERSRQALANTIFAGVPFVTQNTTTANLTYNQGFQTGTLLTATFNNSRTTTNAFSSLNPSLSSTFRATVRQHLLSGCCMFVNRRNIISAGYNKQIADIAFENQVMFTVTQIQDIYWDLVNAYQNLLVKQRSLALANKTLSDNQKQVEIGTLAPIEVVRAQSAVSSAQQDLIVAQTNLQLEQLLMKNAITRNLQDPALATAPVIPTDTMVVVNEQLPPVDELIKEALQRRPDINSQRIDLKNRDISRRATKNALLPTLDLLGFYGGSGLSGNGQDCVRDANNLLICTPTGINSGLGSAFGDQFNSTNPDKGVAFQLNIPILNRTAQADQARSQIEYRQAELLLHQLESQINIGVRNALYAVQQNTAAVAAAKAAQELAAQSLDAEQKKYALGASTNTLVLQAQRDMTQAEVNYVTALTNYEKSRVTLDQVTGQTLDRLGIVLSDAAIGKVSALPNVPGVVNANSPEAQQQMTPSQKQQQQQEPPNPQ